MDAHPLPVEPARGRSMADEDAASQDDALLRILADGHHHRLDDLASALVDTPDRVARRIASLAAFGMAVDTDRDGARAAPCVVLDAASIESLLHAGRPSDAAPWQASVVFATDSTNDDVLAAVRATPDFHGPMLRAAEIQRNGRGRLGRSWVSAPGASLTVSFALRVARPLATLDGVTLACGLAVHGVIASRGAAARLKWPNDILLDGRKLAGILVEATTVRGGTALVIGVGINLAAIAVPDGVGLLPGGPASLQVAGAAPLNRNALVARLALALEAQMARFAADGFAAFAVGWNAVDAYRDAPVTLTSARDADVVGIARGVDARGALLLDVDGDRRRIIAGDVSLRASTAAMPLP